MGALKEDCAVIPGVTLSVNRHWPDLVGQKFCQLELWFLLLGEVLPVHMGVIFSPTVAPTKNIWAASACSGPYSGFIHTACPGV